MSRAIVVSSPLTVELAEEALDPADVLAGDPVTAATEIAAAPLPGGGVLSTGVWRCTRGRVRDVEVDETFIVLSGRATIAHDGVSHEVGPGDVCVLAAGTTTTWTVHETLRKVYVIREGGTG